MQNLNRPQFGLLDAPNHPESQLVLRVMPMPADANVNGDIFGGWIMAQVDVAGAVLASRVAKGRLATVAVNQFIFKQPVSVGDLLSFYARVERIGRTSITVNVEVYAERNPAAPLVVKVTEASLTYVAIDLRGKPRELSRGE
ncbi:acyl-CoA thioesterase [Methylibium sp.]|uniref:acyl-CoA thioesterase n=1 Tax=Methylibium sp. TaxID=2067992 RepID=UPI00286B1B8D|nr:acyl-CoA thioesterase [Methylibium sp.]